ncbi:DedA family protein [Streptomyces sp. NPDC015414]|uniref:DedA family protein n=1 Tax=Streptomyces sp. NPDC015414 TaxID=3364957 RepID=UPI0036FC7813
MTRQARAAVTVVGIVRTRTPLRSEPDHAKGLGPHRSLRGTAAGRQRGRAITVTAAEQTSNAASGALARAGGLRLTLIIAVASCAVVAGEAIGHRTGRLLGSRLPTGRLGRRMPAAAWQRAEALMTRRGGQAIFLARFVAAVRTLAPHLAGATGLPYRRIAPYSLLAAPPVGRCRSHGRLRGSHLLAACHHSQRPCTAGSRRSDRRSRPDRSPDPWPRPGKCGRPPQSGPRRRTALMPGPRSADSARALLMGRAILALGRPPLACSQAPCGRARRTPQPVRGPRRRDRRAGSPVGAAD